MRTLEKRLAMLVGASLASMTAASAQAQTPPAFDETNVVQERPAASEIPVPDRSPAVSFLMAEYNLSEEEAAMRMEVQTELTETVATLRSGSVDGFSEIYIEHEPNFKVIVGFNVKDDRKTFRESLPSSVRRHVQIKYIRLTQAEILQGLDDIARLLSGAGVAYEAAFNPKNGKFEVRVDDKADRKVIRTLLPKGLAQDTSVVFTKVGKLDRQARASGIQSEDRISAGRRIIEAEPTNTRGDCTTGYNVRLPSGGLGLLTAGHCVPGNDFIQQEYPNRHWINLAAPVYNGFNQRSDTGDDFAVYDITGAVEEPWIYYRNLEAIPEFPEWGWFIVAQQYTRDRYGKGWTVCKSGNETGITCAQVINAHYRTYEIPDGVEVGYTRQSRISEGGDSGGPWFVYPGGQGQIRVNAIGTHVGKVGTRTIFLPLERAQEAYGFTLVTSP